MEFSDRQESKSFYDQRYSHGYMGHWSVFEKRRIFDLVKELNLPSRGKALDFGCGRGNFTAVIKEALPGWEVFGCDISSEAIAAASSQNKEIKFFSFTSHAGTYIQCTGNSKRNRCIGSSCLRNDA